MLRFSQSSNIKIAATGSSKICYGLDIYLPVEQLKTQGDVLDMCRYAVAKSREVILIRSDPNFLPNLLETSRFARID
jgi:hypothetical protein